MATMEEGYWPDSEILNQDSYFSVGDATTKLNNEIAFVNDATDSDGTLTLGLALADQRVHDAALELDQIALTIKQLQGMKVLVKTSKGSGLVDGGELAMGVGLAAAFGFGGPAAGAFALGVLKSGSTNGKEALTPMADRLTPSAARGRHPPTDIRSRGPQPQPRPRPLRPMPATLLEFGFPPKINAARVISCRR